MSETTEPVRVPPAPEKQSPDRWKFRRWVAVVVAIALVGAGVLIGTQIADDGKGEINRLEQEIDVAQAAQRAVENRPPETPQACLEALDTAEALIARGAKGSLLLIAKILLAAKLIENRRADDAFQALDEVDEELFILREPGRELPSILQNQVIDCRAAAR